MCRSYRLPIYVHVIRGWVHVIICCLYMYMWILGFWSHRAYTWKSWCKVFFLCFAKKQKHTHPSILQAGVGDWEPIHSREEGITLNRPPQEQNSSWNCGIPSPQKSRQPKWQVHNTTFYFLSLYAKFWESKKIPPINPQREWPHTLLDLNSCSLLWLM